MKCAPFDYIRASSVEQAVTTLADCDGDGKILAGGQSLVPLLALRMARPSALVDINRIAGIGSISPADGVVDVGALTRHSALAAQAHHPLLAEAARCIGHTAIRARGTAGGSLAHADPAAELPVVAVATGATVRIAGPAGTRTTPADELFVAALTTSLADDEMITTIRFPQPARWGFAEFARRHGDFALVTAVVTEIAGTVRITLGGVASTPVRATQAERILAGGGTARAAAAAAAAEIDPATDLHGPAPFRRAITAEMARRALAQAGID
jgi:carbon-monoxide dehydrogenase medium subunit